MAGKGLKKPHDFLPYARHSISQEDIESVIEVLRSDFLTQGPAVERFESEFCAATGAPFAVACANGTAALHLAVLAGNLGNGDRVVTTPISFVASANAARFVGADVRFADIDGKTLNLSPSSVEDALIRSDAEGCPVRAVITVDLAGQPCDMEAFGRLRERFGFLWIQDASHSLGATWTNGEGRSFRIGEWEGPDLTTFSFHAIKNITTGEGGMITTHRADLAEKLRRFRSHGIVREPGQWVFPEEGFEREISIGNDASRGHGENRLANPWYYEMQTLGFNYRLTDIQCALGLSQLKRLKANVEKRRGFDRGYRERMKGQPWIRFPVEPDGTSHAHHLSIVRLDYPGFGKTRREVMSSLHDQGIGTQVHYIPIPMMPFHAGSESMVRLPEALAYYREALSLPCFAEMKSSDVERTAKALTGIFE